MVPISLRELTDVAAAHPAELVAAAVILVALACLGITSRSQRRRTTARDPQRAFPAIIRQACFEPRRRSVRVQRAAAVPALQGGGGPRRSLHSLVEGRRFHTRERRGLLRAAQPQEVRVDAVSRDAPAGAARAHQIQHLETGRRALRRTAEALR